ncbi:MAG: UDP-N-acetylglucosamine 2-epimerase (hydrolyzing) [Alphaproteobacteria bacterium]|nr:UDP-N-acetylglucosamine 2-epimerase (hydrolyzing) [Alphaproteobacteria bacterium]
MKIHYVSGSRADFGLMQATLVELSRTEEFDLGVVVTGQHLIKHYGYTKHNIVQSGLPIIAEIPVRLGGKSGLEMGLALADQTKGFFLVWGENRPDLILLLGDRGEMLAAAIAAVHLGIHVGHIHGGELSGTIDESFRHAVSKLSHFHFTSSDDARQRLIKMGEKPEHIWTVGAPGLVGIQDGVIRQQGWLHKEFALSLEKQSILCVFHPVVQEAVDASSQIGAILHMLERKPCGGIILRPNSDAGGATVDAALTQFETKWPTVSSSKKFLVIDHLPRALYLNCLANVDIMVGNSSSGIIESASFGTLCLNIGKRQQGRLRNTNVVDCLGFSFEELSASYDKAFACTSIVNNKYGDGKTASRLRQLLLNLPLDNTVLAKSNSY